MKSAKEKLNELLGWGEDKKRDSAVLRILRQVAREAYETGLRDGGSLSPASLADQPYMDGLKRRTIVLIIDGKKGRRK